MNISKTVFYAYFIWAIGTMIAMSMPWIGVIVAAIVMNKHIFSQSGMFLLNGIAWFTKFIEVVFLIVMTIETAFSVVAIFSKRFSNKDKFLLIPLLLSLPFAIFYLFKVRFVNL